MSGSQTVVLGILLATLALLAWGRWRYDLVALLALLTLTIAGYVAPEDAFDGFGHPAVITVAAVLVVSRGLLNSGVVDLLTRELGRIGGHALLQMTALTTLAALASAFMNNVGALALLMPVAMQTARRRRIAPSALLMPLAFASLLGGLITLIGTPPNVVIATYRMQETGVPFRMFDFTPVGAGVAAAGILFIALLGWRLIPRRQGRQSPEELFEISDYIAEVEVPKGAPVVGRTVQELETLDDAEVTVVGIVRSERRMPAPSGGEIVRADDVLIVKADPADLKTLLDAGGLQLVGDRPLDPEKLGSDEVVLLEAVVRPNARIVGKTARTLNLRRRFGVNLLAVARAGQRVKDRLARLQLRAGDVLLVQGSGDLLQEAIADLGLLPLAERKLRLGQPRRTMSAVSIFGLGLATAALGVVPVQVAFVCAAVAMVLTGLLPLRDAYDSIDWPILVLLGAMIPVGQALETTGVATTIAGGLLAVGQHLPPWATLTVVLVATMFLSDVINNTAAAVLMAPIGLGVARGLGVHSDAFLMAVAIGASCAFLTPVGHQSNTLVMGPGGYRFGDYWRMGLPLELLITLVAVPLLLHFWPL
ncbi:MAG: SLC13 family permease [Armatimonadota bacterium]|nr:SLC13 family permease [Armatimonadota bacterium]MDR7509662.1 SLC13 family permease [Armatimonadota bacterium]MDR7561485.1 SLC13 family permease [Armatimonadota bacterium]MDR7582148.1 SLC13 family permease [Armatimonadota bacterium]MDR7587743.1 SLC13 family permease [Armatimonadota bacterium]